jgi:hypothetical protein
MKSAIRRLFPGASRPLETNSPALWLAHLSDSMEANRVLSARTIAMSIRASRQPRKFRDVEFKCFSQFGDDGIVQYLVHMLNIEERTFVEFGVEDYREANTRFLLVSDNWRGLVMDGSATNVARIKSDPICWRHDLTAASAFIDAENIDSLIDGAGISGDIGLLSVDIDGNDYWVWKAISVVRPVIVVCEYNSVFGPERAITIPYDPRFTRANAHYSHLYFGASLPALVALGAQKGYSFVGSNSAGNNAYFVRSDRIGSVPVLTAAEGYVCSRFRESRDETGGLSYLAGDSRLEVIRGLPVLNVETGQMEAV